jgi:hypothetical protein
MMTVKEDVAVLPSSYAVNVIELELTFKSVALLIETVPLVLSTFSDFVTKLKDGLRDQVGF